MNIDEHEVSVSLPSMHVYTKERPECSTQGDSPHSTLDWAFGIASDYIIKTACADHLETSTL